MEIPPGYSFTYNQLNQITWDIRVKTPENLLFCLIAQCGPSRPSDLQTFNTLIDKEGRKQFVLEMQENKDFWIIKEEPKKEEIKNEPEPNQVSGVA